MNVSIRPAIQFSRDCHENVWDFMIPSKALSWSFAKVQKCIKRDPKCMQMQNGCRDSCDDKMNKKWFDTVFSVPTDVCHSVYMSCSIVHTTEV